jgi:antitoxin ParD1/3/4
LTPELEQFVQERVASGRYQTASEVVREGLRLLELQERDREAAHEALKAKLKRGAAQAERGEVVDGEEFVEKLIRDARSRSKQSGAA